MSISKSIFLYILGIGLSCVQITCIGVYRVRRKWTPWYLTKATYGKARETLVTLILELYDLSVCYGIRWAVWKIIATQGAMFSSRTGYYSSRTSSKFYKYFWCLNV